VPHPFVAIIGVIPSIIVAVIIAIIVTIIALGLPTGLPPLLATFLATFLATLIAPFMATVMVPARLAALCRAGFFSALFIDLTAFITVLVGPTPVGTGILTITGVACTSAAPVIPVLAALDRTPIITCFGRTHAENSYHQQGREPDPYRW